MSKPFVFEQVMAMIQKHEKSFGGDSVYDMDDSYNFGKNEADINSSVLFDEIVKLLIKESGFDEEFCRELVVDFCKQAKELLNDIKENIDKNNLSEVRINLHSLKGSAGTVRVKDIAKIIAEAEEAAKKEQIDVLVYKISIAEKLLDELWGEKVK